jgi:hypothetical protein
LLTPAETDIRATIAKEARWAEESLGVLRAAINRLPPSSTAPKTKLHRS